MAADARRCRLHHRLTLYLILYAFHSAKSLTFFANRHTGPSGTVKLAKKEPAAKPAAASAKEKKPIAKVHTLARTLVTIPS